jgi:uncharacterized protein
MIRLVFLAAAVLLVFWAIRSLRRGSGEAPPASPEKPPAAIGQEEMVACAKCGVHLPRSEAHSGRNALFCSERHRLELESHEGGDPKP